jgi:hypothetical protein
MTKVSQIEALELALYHEKKGEVARLSPHVADKTLLGSYLPVSLAVGSLVSDLSSTQPSRPRTPIFPLDQPYAWPKHVFGESPRGQVPMSSSL